MGDWPMGGMQNYDYVIDLAMELSQAANPSLLDFGCGRGQVVARGQARGLNITGADTFSGSYETWLNECEPALRERIHTIRDGKLPFADASFDLVISNQVFEHIPDYKPSLTELHRVLKPGGKLIALFPVRETWYEGHVGLYFPQYLSNWPRLQYAYLHTCHLLGFGLHKPSLPLSEWTQMRQTTLQTDCFYHPAEQFCADLTLIWHCRPQQHLAHYIKWRLARHPRLRPLLNFNRSGWFDPLLDQFCLRRGGLIVSVTKTG